MKSPGSLLATACLVAASATAHFQMLYPEVTGFNDRLQDQGPCGGNTLDFTNPKTQFKAGGDAIAIKNLHSQGQWLYRGSLENVAAPTKWVRLHPITFQGGLGSLCQPAVAVPASWVGKKGVISAVNNAPDGLLYQCAAVTFVAGTGTPPSSCTNTTGIQVSFTTDDQLAPLAGVDDGSSSGGSTGGGSTGGNGTTTPGSTPSPTNAVNTPATSTTRPNGAARLVDGSILLGASFAAMVMVVLGNA